MNKPSKEKQREEVAALLRSLANPNRLAILCALAERSRAVAELEAELAIRQPILSQQLAILRDAGLVATSREQKSVVYHLADHHAAFVARVLQAVFQPGSAATTTRREVPSPARAAPPCTAAVFARVEQASEA